MLAGTKNAAHYAEWLAHIESSETKDALRYLIGIAATVESLTCHPQYKGLLRDFRFLNSTNDQPFSFIPNKRWLLFYFRLPAVRSGRYSIATIRAAFDSTRENKAGEWTVKLHNISDVQRLWQILAVQ